MFMSHYATEVCKCPNKSEFYHYYMWFVLFHSANIAIFHIYLLLSEISDSPLRARDNQIRHSHLDEIFVIFAS